jgi:hypothetical protein
MGAVGRMAAESDADTIWSVGADAEEGNAVGETGAALFSLLSRQEAARNSSRGMEGADGEADGFDTRAATSGGGGAGVETTEAAD